VQLYKAFGGRSEQKAANFKLEFEDMVQAHTLSLLPCTSDDVSFVELRQSFPSQIQAISPFIDQLMHFIAKSRSMDGSEMDIEIALGEALENAIVHGNREDPDKRVYLTCRCTSDGEVSITVQDEGQGFNIGALPDPTAQENRLRTSGRGIYLMKALMDEVRFEKGGAVVHMCKKSNGSARAKSKVQ
jgi:serine/threonine-protein kinase RsbW